MFEEVLKMSIGRWVHTRQGNTPSQDGILQTSSNLLDDYDWYVQDRNRALGFLLKDVVEVRIKLFSVGLSIGERVDIFLLPPTSKYSTHLLKGD